MYRGILHEGGLTFGRRGAGRIVKEAAELLKKNGISNDRACELGRNRYYVGT